MARPRRDDGGLYKREESKIWWMRYRGKDGIRRLESTLTEDWGEAQKRLRERLQARDNNTLSALRRGQDLQFGEWADFYLESFSKPPFRAPKTHAVNHRALKHLGAVFENVKLAQITADDIETYLRRRLKQRVRRTTKNGFVKKGLPRATTVHQELRVLRRMLNVAVRKKFLFANPCAGVEFPARVDGLFRPHYVTWSEQNKIEFNAPGYLRNVIRIITETGLRIYKELTPMKKDQLDLENRTVWIPDSKTPNGVAEVPLTEIAADAFRHQLAISGPGPYLFPSDRKPDVHQKSLVPAVLRMSGSRSCSTGRCESVQEILADETADEARGANQIESPNKRRQIGFWHSAAKLRRVLTQFWHSWVA